MSRYKDISKQIAYLRGLISKAEDSLQGKPEGRLHVCKSHGTSQFYEA